MRDDFLADTRPHQPVRPRGGCRGWVAAALLALVMLPVFLCGLGLVIYLVFPPQQMDILILGLDARDGEGFVSRTDSVMLLGISPARLRVSLLSIPRDVFIQTPGYGLQRINTINVLGEQQAPGGGPELLAESLASSLSVRPERYVRLNFGAFVELVDAVGGVTVDVPRTLVDNYYPTEDGGVTTVRFESGLQHMDGERALIYARTRYADDDYRRAERQQQIVSALAGKLVNPAYWPAALAVLNRAVDTDLTFGDLLALAPPVVLSGGRFDQLVIDRDYLLGTGEGYAVLNYEKIAPWLQGRFE